MKRRSFLKTAAVAAIPAATFGQPLALAAEPSSTKTTHPAEGKEGEMKYRVLGRTGQKISILGLGGYHLGMLEEEKESIDLDGGFYGWPYSYFGQHVDVRVQPPRPDLVAKAIVPDYALGPHTACLGLCYPDDNALPEQFHSGMFIGQHRSWNRKRHSGYKVIFAPFTGGVPSAQPIDVLTGFLSNDEKAYGRPVGVVIDKTGALLVADDVGNVVWRVR